MQFFKDAIEFFKNGAIECFGSAETGKRILIVLAIFSVLHFLTVFMPEPASWIAAALNIVAHVRAIVYFMWLRLTIYQAVLVFMASIFVYTMFNFIPYLIYKSVEKKNAIKNANNEGGATK